MREENKKRVTDQERREMSRDVMEHLELMYQEADRSVVEAVKTLRTNLIYSGDVQAVTVTSTQAGEGKSTVSFLLAMSFAKLKKKTLYIDCDLRKSVFLKRYGVEDEVDGLSEFLSGQSSRIVHGTNIPNLYILPAGKYPPNPVELLSGERFKGLMRILRNTYDYIILDAPPIGSVIDASIIEKETDGILLVVRNDFVKRNALRHVQQQIAHNGGKVLGIVLNRIKKYQKDYYYGREYGKYYGDA